MTDNTQDPVEITIDTMANGGQGMGRHEGRVVFVPFTIPGETLTARIVRAEKRVAFAEGVTLLDPSADRVLPACPHFGPKRCGGCQWQHIDHSVQHLIKQDVLADQLERVGGVRDDVVRPILAPMPAWAYRHAMTFAPTPDGFGLTTADGNPLPITTCPVAHPDIMGLFDQLDIDPAPFAKLRLMRGDEGALMVVLYAKEEEAPELTVDLPASVNLVLPDNEPLNLAGDTHVTYTVKGRAFRVTAGSFFRDAPDELPALVDAVLEALGDAKTVIDLYAGVGLFGAFAADKADYVTLVESYPPAATDADSNTAALEHVDVIEGSVSNVLAAAEPYEAAIVNPPSRGLSVDVVDALAELAPHTLVYVSSDAATLSRDVKRLTAHGYRLAWVQPVDTAPQTFALEAVARLTRKR